MIENHLVFSSGFGAPAHSAVGFAAHVGREKGAEKHIVCGGRHSRLALNSSTAPAGSEWFSASSARVVCTYVNRTKVVSRNRLSRSLKTASRRAASPDKAHAGSCILHAAPLGEIERCDRDPPCGPRTPGQSFPTLPLRSRTSQLFPVVRLTSLDFHGTNSPKI